MHQIDVVYDVVNGLSGVQRDIILRLCALFWNKSDEIKSIIGMCKEHFDWKNRSFFVNSRPKVVPYVFRSVPDRGCTLTPTPKGVKCVLTTKSFHTLFFDQLINEGVYRWTVQIVYGTNGYSFNFGAANRMDLLFMDCISYGGACFHFWQNSSEKIPRSMLDGVEGYSIGRGTEHGAIVVPSGGAVAMETDTETRTLCFFVNDRKICYGISEVIVPFYMGLTQCGGHDQHFISLSFRRLPSATPVSSHTALFPHTSSPSLAVPSSAASAAAQFEFYRFEPEEQRG